MERLVKKTSLILLAGLALAACGKDVTAPAANSTELDEAAELAFSTSFISNGGSMFVPDVLRHLPEALRLSPAQESSIKALLEAFRDATKADREALIAIGRRAHDAAAAGASSEAVRAILAEGNPIRARLEAAETKLRADILAVLTPQQKAFIESHEPHACINSLTPEQRTQISALFAAFEQANQADLDAIKAAFEQARTAQHNGATRAQIEAILENARPAVVRVRQAQLQLAVAIAGVLTPGQLASACRPTVMGR